LAKADEKYLRPNEARAASRHCDRDGAGGSDTGKTFLGEQIAATARSPPDESVRLADKIDIHADKLAVDSR